MANVFKCAARVAVALGACSVSVAAEAPANLAIGPFGLVAAVGDAGTQTTVLVSSPRTSGGETSVDVLWMMRTPQPTFVKDVQVLYVRTPVSFSCGQFQQRRFRPTFVDANGTPHQTEEQPAWGSWGEAAPVKPPKAGKDVWYEAYRVACGERAADEKFVTLESALKFAREPSQNLQPLR
jgi:hypothetical protein